MSNADKAKWMEILRNLDTTKRTNRTRLDDLLNGRIEDKDGKLLAKEYQDMEDAMREIDAASEHIRKRIKREDDEEEEEHKVDFSLNRRQSDIRVPTVPVGRLDGSSTIATEGDQSVIATVKESRDEMVKKPEESEQIKREENEDGRWPSVDSPDRDILGFLKDSTDTTDTKPAKTKNE